jgi:hypothetical protein
VISGGLRRTWYGHRYISRIVEVYDPVAERIVRAAPLPKRRLGAAAIGLSGALLLVGGEVAALPSRRGHPTAAIDRLHVRSGRWSTIAALLAPRAHARAVLAGRDHLLVIGGDRTDAERLFIGDEDPVSVAAPAPRDDAAFVEARGTAYLIGGQNAVGRRYDTIEAFPLVERLHAFRRCGENAR